MMDLEKWFTDSCEVCTCYTNLVFTVYIHIIILRIWKMFITSIKAFYIEKYLIYTGYFSTWKMLNYQV